MLELSKSASLALESMLLKTPAKYPLRTVKMSRLSIPRGVDRTPQNTLFSGQVPRRLIMGFIARDAFHGAKKKDPFRYQSFGLNRLTVTAGGVQYPRLPLEMDFSKNLYVRAYLNFLECLGFGAPNKDGVNIDIESYKEGLCLHCFDLSSDQTADSSHWDLSRTGSVSIEAQFSAPLTTDIELIVYSESDGIMRLDAYREPHTTLMG